MWPYHPDLLERPVPRYTSYPTAAEFHDGVGEADQQAALANMSSAAELSLYVHIPYCEKICFYCGCNTGAANKSQRLAAYLAALEAEIDLVAARLAGRGRVTRIAFGGGSPNAIAPTEFLRLLGRLRSAFAADHALVSIELDPRALTDSWIEAVAIAGVRNASLGVQTFDPTVQQAIGRVQPEQSIRGAAEALRAAGIASLNFDLMYGLPGQSLDSLIDTLRTAAAIAPDRIALFGYAHVPHMIPRQRRIDDSALPGLSERFAAAAVGHRFLVDRGYEAVGFDHFASPADPLAAAAREGRLRRNFQGFTDDQADILIGLGASAISRFPGLLVQNEKNAGRYRLLVSAGRLTGVRGIARDAGERRRARIIEELLCKGEADIAGIAADLERFEARGLVTRSGTTIRLAPGALPYARGIAAAFDVHRQQSPTRFSNAV